MEEEDKYKSHYSDGGFWQVIKRHIRELPFVMEVLALYYCLNDPRTPSWVKVAIAAALGYFICPIDVIPDFLPIVGWLDDAGVIAAAFKTVQEYITANHRKQADKVMEDS